MGRTAEVRHQMEQNDPKPIKLDEDTQFIQDTIAEACGEFPKCMYRLALRNGLPAGDVANPDYPLPMDLAAQLGLDQLGFKVIGRNKDSAGNLIVRLPYVTRLVGTMNADMTVDVAAARAEEARLRLLGWVDSPSKIKGLPVPPTEQGFDPLPGEDSNGNGRLTGAPSHSIGPATFKQTAESPALINSAESKESNANQPSKRARGGRRPGAGRKPKIAMAAR